MRVNWRWSASSSCCRPVEIVDAQQRGRPLFTYTPTVTRLVCGYFELDRDIDHPLVAELPAFLHVADVDRRWVDWLATLSSMLMAEAGLPDEARKLATKTLLAQLQLRKSQETWAMSKRVFRHWHLFHLPLAKVMYLIILLHVAFALLFSGGLQSLMQPPF